MSELLDYDITEEDQLELDEAGQLVRAFLRWDIREDESVSGKLRQILKDTKIPRAALIGDIMAGTIMTDELPDE